MIDNMLGIAEKNGKLEDIQSEMQRKILVKISDHFWMYTLLTFLISTNVSIFLWDQEIKKQN